MVRCIYCQQSAKGPNFAKKIPKVKVITKSYKSLQGTRMLMWLTGRHPQYVSDTVADGGSPEVNMSLVIASYQTSFQEKDLFHGNHVVID
jgi:hypothetical protein